MQDKADSVQVDVLLDRGSPIPLYHQLAVAIETAISTGALRPGDRLENEVSLTRRLGLARPTARQAIEQLVKKGLVVRKRGVGTQVVHSQINRDAKLSSLYDDLQAAGRQPTTTLLELSTEASAPGELAGEFVKVRRLRSADGEPLAILTNYLPARYSISEADLANSGLYASLRALGVNLKIAHQSVGARLMTQDEAELLDEPMPAACLTVERTVYDDTGQLVEFAQHVYRATNYRIRTALLS